MKISEWLKIVKVIRTRWPHADLPENTIEQWGKDVADLDAEVVLAVVEAMYREGREFAPNAGQIRSKLAELTIDAPDWGEVKALLARLSEIPETMARKLEQPDAEGLEQFVAVPARADAISAQHPMIGEFVEVVGWEQIYDGLDGGGSDEARLREKWLAFCASAKRNVALAGISAPPELATLHRIAERHGELTRGGGVAEIRKQLEEARDLPEVEIESVDAEIVED